MSQGITPYDDEDRDSSYWDARLMDEEEEEDEEDEEPTVEEIEERDREFMDYERRHRLGDL